MIIELHMFIEDLGDGSHRVVVGSSKEYLKQIHNIDDEDFLPGGEVPVEWDTSVINAEEYKVIN